MTDFVSELIVHVGLPKTGTTAIQRFMYLNRVAFEEKGIYWAETYPNGVHEINDWAHHVYSHKWGGWLDPKKFAVDPDDAWRLLSDTMRHRPGRYVVSSERFADLLPLPICSEMLRFIETTIAPARLKLVGYVRRQDMLIESHIRELLKGGDLTVPLPRYLSNLAAFASFASFGTGFLNAASVVGRENIVARVYERDRLVGRDIIQDFLQACGFSSLPDLEHVSSEANPSLNALSTKVLMDPRIHGRFAGSPYREALVYSVLSLERFKKLDSCSILDAETRASIMEQFNEENRKFSEAFLNSEDAGELSYVRDETRPFLPNDVPVLTIDDLVEIVLAIAPHVLRDFTNKGSRSP